MVTVTVFKEGGPRTLISTSFFKKKSINSNVFAGPLSGFENDALFMSNQILKRLFFENFDFHKKLPVEKYIF